MHQDETPSMQLNFTEPAITYIRNRAVITDLRIAIDGLLTKLGILPTPASSTIGVPPV